MQLGHTSTISFSEKPAPVTTQRAWLAVRLYAQGLPREEIARRLPRAGPGGPPPPGGRPGVSKLIASQAVQAGTHALLGHVMRDEAPPAPLLPVWPPEEVRRDIRAIRPHRLRFLALRRWLRSRPVHDGLG